MSISNDPFKIGEWTVEPELDRISCTNGSTTLRPQVMKLLVFLASNMGKVISTDELLNVLWPNKVVTEGTVYNTLAELRNALATAKDGHTYIETFTKKGYRLVDPAAKDVVGVSNSDLPPSAAGPASARKFSHKSIPALIGGLFVAVAVIFYVAWPRGDAHSDRSIAVLPFEDVSPDGDQAYFGNGIADELRLELQRLHGLRVAGRTSSIVYAQEVSKTVGEALDVDSILEGSIRKEGNEVRVTVQLIHVADGFTLWSESYNRELENIFEIQEEIATSVAGALGVRLGVGTINAFRGAGTRDVEAYEAFLKSQDHKLSRREQIILLEQATERDPNYAAAWSYLGHRTLGTLWGASSDADEASKIKEQAYSLVLKAVELNPESAVAQSRLAMVRSARLDWIGGEQGHGQAIKLLADRPIVATYANTLIRSGRTAYARKQYAIAFALEPLGGRPITLSWHASLAQGRFAEAQAISKWQGPYEHSINNLDIALNKRDAEEIKAAIRTRLKTHVASTSLYALVLAEFDSAEQVLLILHDAYANENLQWPSKLHDIAMVAAYFGDAQFALKVKGREIRTHTTRLSALWYPVMSEVRQLPKFKQLVADLNLVEYWRTYGWADACKPLGEEDFTCS